MKRTPVLLLSVVCFLALLSPAGAESFRAGLHAVCTADDPFGYGVQFSGRAGDHWSLELSGSSLSARDLDGVDVDASMAALTVLFDYPLWKRLRVHAGAGVNYNKMDVDANDYARALADELSAEMGQGYSDVETFLQTLGIYPGAVEVTIDDALGVHACAGLSIVITPRFELFAEYRHVLLNLDASAAVLSDVRFFGLRIAQTSLPLADYDEVYDFGFARAGVNIVF